MLGALSRFVGSCDDFIVATMVPDIGHVWKVQGIFILGDGWSQQRCQPRNIGSQPEWEE